MNVFNELLLSPFDNQLLDILNETNVAESFPSPIQSNVEIKLLQMVMKKPQCGLWQNLANM